MGLAIAMAKAVAMARGKAMYETMAVFFCLRTISKKGYQIQGQDRFWSPKGLKKIFSACGAVLGPRRPAPAAPAVLFLYSNWDIVEKINVVFFWILNK